MLNAACKIWEIYTTAFPEFAAVVPPETELRGYISGLIDAHPEFNRVSKWRVVVTGTVEALDTRVQGDTLPPPKQMHDNIMEKLRNL